MAGSWAVCSTCPRLGFCSGYAPHWTSITWLRRAVSKSRREGREVSITLKEQILLAYFGPSSK
jgi:hypothetical protein